MVGMACLTVCWLPLPVVAESDAPDADADLYAGTLAYKNGDWWFTACNANEADAWRAVWQRPDDQALAGRLLAQYPPRSQQHNRAAFWMRVQARWVVSPQDNVPGQIRIEHVLSHAVNDSCQLSDYLDAVQEMQMGLP